jgi:hypothetical protein
VRRARGSVPSDRSSDANPHHEAHDGSHVLQMPSGCHSLGSQYRGQFRPSMSRCEFRVRSVGFQQQLCVRL